ncbi:MAG: hypothetical protein COA78_10525 [Blastopirellula sp.]|nr:MAG: hypothetical protein COA78_10525 [Blastopirellula sp.]
MSDDPVINPEDNPYVSPATVGASQAEDAFQPKRSRWILAVAVVNLIYSIAPLFYAGMMVINLVFYFPRFLYPIFLWIYMTVFLLPGASLLISGVGLIYRKQWARILSLVIALLMMGCGVWIASIPFWASSPIDPSSMIAVLVYAGIFFAYPILTFCVLLRRKQAAEFTKNIETKSEQPA